MADQAGLASGEPPMTPPNDPARSGESGAYRDHSGLLWHVYIDAKGTAYANSETSLYTVADAETFRRWNWTKEITQ